MLAGENELPTMEWQLAHDDQGLLTVKVDRPMKAIHVWMADSATRGFRKAEWNYRTLDIRPGSSEVSVEVEKPASGYRAFMGEVVLISSTGHEYKLSTQVQVLPNDVE
jgi:PhoPQ-activated pathogenicity-related protein